MELAADLIFGLFMVGFCVICLCSVADEAEWNRRYNQSGDSCLDGMFALFGLTIGALGVLMTAGVVCKILIAVI